MKYKILPTSIIHQMTRNKKADNTFRLKYKEKSYLLSIYSFTKIDLAKIYRVDGQAALFVGSVKDKGREVNLHAKSIGINEIKDILKEQPLVAVLSVEKSTQEAKKFIARVSVAFKDMNIVNELKRETLKILMEHSKKVRDSQVNLLYRWEGKELLQFSGVKGDKAISLGKLNSYAKKIIQFFNLPMDKIHVTNQATRSAKRLGACRVIKDDITSEHPNFAILNIHDSTLNTLVHEIAHLVCYFKHRQISSHGPEYTGVYSYILSKVYKQSENDIRKSMSNFGLKVTKFNGPNKELKL